MSHAPETFSDSEAFKFKGRSMSFRASNIRKLSEISKGSDSNNSDSEDAHCVEDNESSHHSDLKRPRLTSEQVKSLERCFEEENKLEPERKKRLSVELGLHPRQIAVWFQNRRVRWKTKQMEKDYDNLKAEFDKTSSEFKAVTEDYVLLKRDYEDLLAENARLCTRMARLVAKFMEMGQQPDLIESAAEDKNQENQEPESNQMKIAEQPPPNQADAMFGLDRANSCSSENSDVVDPATTNGSMMSVERFRDRLGLGLGSNDLVGLETSLPVSQTSGPLDQVAWPHTEHLSFGQTCLPSIDEMSEQLHSTTEEESFSANWWDNKSFISLLQ